MTAEESMMGCLLRLKMAVPMQAQQDTGAVIRKLIVIAGQCSQCSMAQHSTRQHSTASFAAQVKQYHCEDF